MKSRVIIILAVLLFPAFALAQTSSVPSAFVDVGLSARNAALGTAGAGLSGDISSLFYNPAGLTGVDDRQASFNFAKVFGLVSYNMASVGMPVKFFDDTQQGAALAVVSSGDDVLKELTVIAGYGRKTGPVELGMNLKYHHASFGNNTMNRDDYGVFDQQEFELGMLNKVKGNANGFGVDFGVLYSVAEKIRLGLMVRDLFTPVSWDSKVDNPDAKTKGNYSENIPTEITIGSSFIVSENFLVVADYQPSLSKGVDNKIRGGLELQLWKFLKLRAGLQNIVNDMSDEKYMFGAGINFKVKGYQFFFDFTQMIETIENSNRVSVGFVF